MKSQNKKKGAHLYFMNDKNIKDALVSKRVKSDHIKEFLKDRGFLVAGEATKESLIEKVGAMHLDYNDYLYLAGVLENPDRKESMSSTNIDEKISAKDITSAVNTIIKEFKEDDIAVEIKHTSNKKIVLKTSHVDLDFSKTAMKQQTRKHGEIEIDIENASTSFRFSATDVGSKVKDRLISKIAENSKKEIKPIEIQLEHQNPDVITKFFVDLISGIKGYDLVDVVNVSVKKSTTDKDATDDEQSTVSGMVRNAVIAGKGLLLSTLYKDLASQDFYIYKISWKIAKNFDDADNFTLEAQFGESSKAKGFKYIVKSANRFSRGKVNITPSNLHKTETDSLSKLIYESALASYTNIVSPPTDNNTVSVDEASQSTVDNDAPSEENSADDTEVCLDVN